MRRQLIDAIRWRTRAEPPWRDVPERYGPWDRVYDLFRRWQRDGTWTCILDELHVQADAKGLITWDVSVDSAVRRAHQHAAGARKKGICNASPLAGSTPSPRTVDSLQRRLTTKIHLATEQRQKPLSLLITVGD